MCDAKCAPRPLLLLQYMVKRKGLDFTEYGLVDARAAKRQRLTGGNNDPKYAVKYSCMLVYINSFYALF